MEGDDTPLLGTGPSHDSSREGSDSPNIAESAEDGVDTKDMVLFHAKVNRTVVP